MAAGLVMRGVLRNRIIKKEQIRAASLANGKRRILPAMMKMPMVDTAIYRALGGKASNAYLQRRGTRKALRQMAMAPKVTAAVHQAERGALRRILSAPVRLAGRALARKKKA